MFRVIKRLFKKQPPKAVVHSKGKVYEFSTLEQAMAFVMRKKGVRI